MAYSLNITKTQTFLRRCASTLTPQPKIRHVVDLIKNVKAEGVTAHVKGWIKGVRKLKNFVFINISDGSCSNSLQIVLPKPKYTDRLSYGASIGVTGTLKSKPNGEMEVHADSVDVYGKFDVTDGYPFTPGQNHPFDYIRQYLHHRPKLTFFSTMLRIRHSVSIAIHNYFSENKFVGVHTPILTSNDCEGAGETFMVQPSSNELLNEMKKENQSKEEIFFNNKAFLTVSGQLHLEIITRSIPKVYTFNPVFRAENSKSRLHLSEFYMVEAEVAFVDNLRDILTVMEDLLKNIIMNLLSKSADDLNYIYKFNGNSSEHISLLENILKNPFTVMTFSEAKRIIQNHATDLKHVNLSSSNLTKEEEMFLVKYNGHIPLFVVDWPRHSKPFYVKSCTDNPEQVEAVDLLVPGVGELCGGSLREDNYDVLCERIKEGGRLDELSWYLELRKFGSTPTGGFGMGFERLIHFLTNVENIKDTIPFPRWPHSIQL